MSNTKPFVAAAVICEKVVVEPDGVATLVRIVDRLAFDDPHLPPDTLPAAQLTAFFSIKSGDVRGTSELSLRLRRPDGGVVVIPNKWPVLLKGDEHGANLKLDFGLPLAYGLFWLDLFWNGEVLTSVPFRLAPTDPGEQASPGTHSPTPVSG